MKLLLPESMRLDKKMSNFPAFLQCLQLLVNQNKPTFYDVIFNPSVLGPDPPELYLLKKEALPWFRMVLAPNVDILISTEMNQIAWTSPATMLKWLKDKYAGTSQADRSMLIDTINASWENFVFVENGQRQFDLDTYLDDKWLAWTRINYNRDTPFMPEEAFLNAVVSKLPHWFGSFVTAYYATGNSIDTFQKLRDKLVIEARHKDDMHKSAARARAGVPAGMPPGAAGVERASVFKRLSKLPDRDAIGKAMFASLFGGESQWDDRGGHAGAYPYAGRGRGRGRGAYPRGGGRPGRGGGGGHGHYPSDQDFAYNDLCWYCNKPGHHKSECRKYADKCAARARAARGRGDGGAPRGRGASAGGGRGGGSGNKRKFNDIDDNGYGLSARAIEVVTV
jgi:hypothetical protein